MRAITAAALLTVAIGWRTLTLRRNAAADDDAGDEHEHNHAEDNTYGLPQGDPIAEALKAWYDKLAKEVLDAIPQTGTELPATLPAVTQWGDKMAEAMTPLLAPYWDDSGKKTMARLGLDPDEWRVTNPHLRAQIEQQAHDFTASTLATTQKDIDRAKEQLRHELAAGLVEHGETLRQLTARVQAVFEEMPRWKAAQIAATEASRAVHSAQLAADHESGVVAGVELLLSSDACPLCRKIATEAQRVRLGQAFAVIGSNPTYKTIKHPPLHPHCQCAMIEVLKPEWGGPEHVEWSETLHQPQKGLGDEYEPPAGQEVPKPKPDALKLLKPAKAPETTPPKESPRPTSTPVSDALDVQVSGALGHNLKGAIDAIDEVHGDGVLPKLPVKDKVRIGTNEGEFSYTNSGRALGIGIHPKADHPDLTLVHEAGHFLDTHGIPGGLGTNGGKSRDYATDPHLAGWHKAVMESDAVRALQAASGPQRLKVKENGQERTVKLDGKYVAYLLTPEELWARSYAQYVATRGNDGALKLQLGRVLGRKSEAVIPHQWPAAQFEPIAVEIDKLFKSLGWLPPPRNPYA